MANPDFVRLRSPKGEVQVVDPSSFDVAGALKNGFTREGNIMVAAHSRSYPKRAASAPPEENALVAALPAIMGGLGGATGAMLGGGTAGMATIGTGGVAAPTIPPAALGGGIMGSMAGGAAGQGMRLLADKVAGVPVPEGAMNIAGSVANEGSNQGAYQLGGELLPFAARSVAQPLMQAAGKLMPEQAQMAARYGITATQMGLKKLGRILSDSGPLGALKGQIIRAAQASGVTHDPLVVVQNSMAQVAKNEPAVAKILSNGQLSPEAVIHPEDELRASQYNDMWQKFLADNPGPVKPVPLEASRKRFSTDAENLFEMRKAGASKAEIASASPEEAWKASMADAIRKDLEAGTSGSVVPDPKTGVPLKLADVNREMSSLIDLKDALTKVAGTRGPAAQFALHATPRVAVGGTIGAISGGTPQERLRRSAEGAALAALATPEAMSQMALLLRSPAVASVLAQVPRTGGYVLSGQ